MHELLQLHSFVLNIGIPCGRETLKLTEVSASDKLEGFRATKEVSSQLFSMHSISTKMRLKFHDISFDVLTNKPMDIEVPQAVLPDSVFEAAVRT